MTYMKCYCHKYRSHLGLWFLCKDIVDIKYSRQLSKKLNKNVAVKSSKILVGSQFTKFATEKVSS